MRDLPARYDTARFGRFRRPGNRKLPQRRPLRRLLPSPRAIAAGAARGIAAAARRSAPVLAGLAALALVGLGAWRGYLWVMSSPRFAIRQIVVTGNVRVPEDELLRRAGLAPGRNVFSVRLADVERQLAQHPWIASVRASRRLPDTLTIRVTERQPAALVLLGAPYLADRQGRPFKRAAIEAGEADDLLVVSGLDRKAYARQPEGVHAQVRRALELADRWHRSGTRPAIGEVHVGGDELTLYMLEGAVAVRLGDLAIDQLAPRLERFDVVWTALSPEERAVTRTIHLDSDARPDRVTLKLADAR